MSRVAPEHSCPRCSCTEINRVHREGVVDRVAGALGWRVYRSRDCGKRFYDRPLRRKAS